MIGKTNHAEMWRALFEEHHSQLAEVAEILLDCSGSPEQILQMAFAELEHHPLYKPFGQISAVRAVVKAAVAHNYTRIDSWIPTTSSGPIDCEHAGPQSLEILPWAERAAYFLHEVLHYSRRDIALLLGISDANVDELSRFARKRMGIPVENLHQSRMPHTRSTQAACPAHSMAFAAFE
jgi:Sigma-70, region 4